MQEYEPPERQMTLEFDDSTSGRKLLPETFAVPCNHSNAVDGVFYCKPEFYGGNISEKCHYFLADTKKLLAKIQHDDPKMIEHSEAKFRDSTVEEWLDGNSARHPCNTGTFVYGPFRASGKNPDGTNNFTLSSGMASILVLARELELPYVPIGLHKQNDFNTLQELKNIIEYRVEGSPVYDYEYDQA